MGAFQVGQKLLSTAAVGGVVGGAVGAYEQYGTPNYNQVDAGDYARKGIMAGLGIGAISQIGPMKSAIQRSLKNSHFTNPVSPGGNAISPQQASLLRNFG